MTEDTLTRKDIARLLDVSVRTVAACEATLGLKQARINVTRKTIRYARRVLRKNEAWFRAIENTAQHDNATENHR